MRVRPPIWNAGRGRVVAPHTLLGYGSNLVRARSPIWNAG